MGWRKNRRCYRVNNLCIGQFIVFVFWIFILHLCCVYSMNALREQTTKEDLALKKKIMAEGPQASYGYGGKFGVQQDR